jgi:hypothetical protein
MPGHYDNKAKDMPKDDKKKKEDKPKKKAGGSWMAFLAKFRKDNPKLKGKEVMKKAGEAYRKQKK